VGVRPHASSWACGPAHRPAPLTMAYTVSSKKKERKESRHFSPCCIDPCGVPHPQPMLLPNRATRPWRGRPPPLARGEGDRSRLHHGGRTVGRRPGRPLPPTRRGLASAPASAPAHGHCRAHPTRSPPIVKAIVVAGLPLQHLHQGASIRFLSSSPIYRNSSLGRSWSRVKRCVSSVSCV
jgi:hypothetical protein